jgi:low affinity Fe/Cu permease
MPKVNWYSQFAKNTAHICGRPRVFTLAVAIILLWVITGPLFGFSNTWQLVINTGTTIITFLMVFLIQNTQNRDTEAIQAQIESTDETLETLKSELSDQPFKFSGEVWIRSVNPLKPEEKI